MSAALSSWKEIAAYMGKGVRTVQRWEEQFGLPVRRPNAKSHVIFAIPEELDAWIKSHQQHTGHHPAKTVESVRKRRQLNHQLFARLHTSYSRLQQNEQALGRNITRFIERISGGGAENFAAGKIRKQT